MRQINVVKNLVSCIIPCYNTDEFIGELLESIANQSYNMLELIFVDDGSQDNTYFLLEQFKRKFNNVYEIHIEKHDVNKGICGAINTGLKHVHGEYFCWFDSDDILDVNCIKKKIEFLKSHMEYKCVMGCANIFEKNVTNVVGCLGNEPRIGNTFDNYLFQFCATSPGLNMTYTNVLLDLLPEYGLREDVTEQNWYLMLLLAAAVDIGFIPDIVYNYRINMNSDSHKNPIKTGYDYKKFYDSVDRIRFHSIDDSRLQYAYKCRCNKMQAYNSIVDRILSIDEEQMQDDKLYVQYIVKEFLNNGQVFDKIRNRKVYIYGTSAKQRVIGKILGKFINISGYIDSRIEDIDNQVINGAAINRDEMFIIVPLQYHKEILDIFESRQFINNLDYYYPKAQLRQLVEQYKDFDYKGM